MCIRDSFIPVRVFGWGKIMPMPSTWTAIPGTVCNITYYIIPLAARLTHCCTLLGVRYSLRAQSTKDSEEKNATISITTPCVYECHIPVKVLIVYLGSFVIHACTVHQHGNSKFNSRLDKSQATTANAPRAWRWYDDIFWPWVISMYTCLLYTSPSPRD